MKTRQPFIPAALILSSLAMTSPATAEDVPANNGGEHSTFETHLDTGYDQPLRPQFHFTSRKNWLRKKAQPNRDDGIRRIPAPAVDGQVALRDLVDRVSRELLVNDGQAAASFVVVPDPENRRIAIDGADGLVIKSLVVNELRSIWPN